MARSNMLIELMAHVSFINDCLFMNSAYPAAKLSDCVLYPSTCHVSAEFVVGTADIQRSVLFC